VGGRQDGGTTRAAIPAELQVDAEHHCLLPYKLREVVRFSYFSLTYTLQIFLCTQQCTS
jgi:hypothetical protein